MTENASETRTDEALVNENAAVVYEPDEDESVTEAVVTAVSEASNAGETNLKPLYGVVDPDALDSLFTPRRDGTPRGAGHVVFTYGSYRVRVESDGSVAVSGREERR